MPFSHRGPWPGPRLGSGHCTRTLQVSLNRTQSLPAPAGPVPRAGLRNLRFYPAGPEQALGPGPLQPSPSLWYYGRPSLSGTWETTSEGAHSESLDDPSGFVFLKHARRSSKSCSQSNLVKHSADNDKPPANAMIPKFLIHFQETTFGFIVSRKGHEKEKCNDSTQGKNKNINDVITI
jgi:hypothetical protein